MVFHLISCPRNLSTALMYSFAQYPGMSVCDEPFYGVYLEKTGVEHPGREKIMASMPLTEDEAYLSISKIAGQDEHLFLKDMSQHIAYVDDLKPMENWVPIFYIRDPRFVINSFSKVIPDLTLRDIGFGYMKDLYLHFEKNNPVVLDSDDLVLDPEGTLRNLYRELDLPFTEIVLHWPAGKKSYDGVWSEYWYEAVHQSSGFNKKDELIYPLLCDSQQELYEQCLPSYLFLKEKKQKNATKI